MHCLMRERELDICTLSTSYPSLSLFCSTVNTRITTLKDIGVVVQTITETRCSIQPKAGDDAMQQ